MAAEEKVTEDKHSSKEKAFVGAGSSLKKTVQRNTLSGNSLTADDSSTEESDSPTASNGAIGCERCGMTFTSAVYRDEHQRLCRGQRRCPQLVEPLSVPTDIQDLVVVVDGKKVFCCSLCQYSTPRGGHMTRHLLSHMGARPFTCIFCGKGFTQGAGLAHHVRIHSGDKPYRCDECEFACGRAIALKRHKNTHTREVMFACEHCDYTTSQAYNLKVHLRTHSGERPYQCKQCDYRAASTCAMRKHERNKHQPKLPCDMCTRTFLNQDKLNKHTAKKHTDGPKRKRIRKRKRVESFTSDDSDSVVDEEAEESSDNNYLVSPDLVPLDVIDTSFIKQEIDEIVIPSINKRNTSGINEIVFHQVVINPDLSNSSNIVTPDNKSLEETNA